MKTFYRTLAIVSAIALAACNKDIVPEPGKPDSPYTPVEYDIDDVLEPSDCTGEFQQGIWNLSETRMSGIMWQ